MACSGNANQGCGGNNYLNVFEDTTFSSTSGLTINDYTPIGCWADNLSGGRALGYEQDQLSGDILTTELCIQACLDLGFPYAGTQYASQCFYEICGGAGAISVYHCEELESSEPCGFNILPPPESSSTTSVSSSSSTSVSSASPPTLPPPTSTSNPSTSTPPTSTPEPPTSTPQPPPPPTSTPKPPTTTPKPPTTTPKSPTTTTSGGLCTATLVTPPKCEYKSGEKFCSLPLRTWDDEQGCNEVHSACKLQVSGCFKNAGWPNAMDCFNFHEWCTTIKYYCKKKSYYGSEFGKDHCFKNYPPADCPPHTTTTSVYPCKSTPPATPTTPPTAALPAGPDRLLQAAQQRQLYTDQDSSKCSSWKRQHTPNACEAACKQQYLACKDTYARGCKNDGKDEQSKEYGRGYPGHQRKGKGGGKWGGGHRGGKGKGGHGGKGKGEYFEYAADSAHTAALEARTHERWQNDGQKAEAACTQQYRDCVAINRDLKVLKDKCVDYGFF
ncbi:WSC domain-containing protein [Apiospora aurea]|uniref:WSC domain-containing protein n=1 Tax=Apiospora aurea TaxID=335848 RepID=A0ABR1QVC5_9PEZI